MSGWVGCARTYGDSGCRFGLGIPARPARGIEFEPTSMNRLVPGLVSALFIALPAAAPAATVDGVTASASWTPNSGLTASVATRKGHLKRVAFRSSTVVTNRKAMTSLIPSSGARTLGTVRVGGPTETLSKLDYLGFDGVWQIRLKSTTSPFVDIDFFGFGEGVDAPSDILRATEPFMTVRRRTVTSPFALENLAKDWNLTSETFSFSDAPTAIAPKACPSINSATLRVERYGAASATVPVSIRC